MKHLKQRISYKKKIANDYEWAKEEIDAILDGNLGDWHSQGQEYARDSRLNMMIRSYELYNNQINDVDFEEYFDSVKYDLSHRKDKIAPYNKAHNKINVLLGEMIKRPFSFKAVLTNIEGARAVWAMRKELLREYVEGQVAKAQILEKINASELDDQQKQQKIQEVEQQFAQIKNPEQIEEYLKMDYLEPREIKANKLLDDNLLRLHIDDKKKDSFKHGLLSAEEHAWVGVVNNTPTIKVLNSPNVIYHKSPDIKYIQDGDFAGYITYMSVADILDTFRDLSKEDIKSLEDKYQHIRNSSYNGEWKRTRDDSYERYIRSTQAGNRGQYGGVYMDDVEVAHVEWRSQRKVGFFSYLNEKGELEQTLVDELFPFNKEDPRHISIEWEWIPERWEGVRIDNSIYTNIGSVPFQYVDPEDPLRQPLSYKGIIYDNTNTTPISTMERMRPFLMLYLVVMHKLKKLISRDRGSIISVDVSKLDPELGLEETMYYLDELDVEFYNSLANAEKPGAAQRGASHNSLSRSNTNQIMQYINILQWLDEQIGDVAGVTRPREGQTSPYEAVANNQQSIMQSSTITEILHFTHNSHWENILNDFVDLAIRVADDEGVNRATLNSSMERGHINIEPGEFDNAKFGVFVTNDPRSTQVYNDLKMMSQVILQRDKGKLSHVIKMLKQKSSIEELTREIEKFEKYVEDSERRAQEAQMQQIKEQAAAEERKDVREKEFTARENKLDRESQERIAEIRSFTFAEDQDVNDNNVPDQLELEKVKANERIADKNIASNERIADKKMANDLQKERVKAKNTPKTKK